MAGKISFHKVVKSYLFHTSKYTIHVPGSSLLKILEPELPKHMIQLSCTSLALKIYLPV